MTQHPEPEPADSVVDPTTDESPPIAPDDMHPEPPAERSRFSQWLASFGLGEFQNPLLTRARPPLPRPPGRG
jgi:hypothetical protein